MKNLTKASIALLLASTAMAHAGGIERTTQSIGIIFEEGTYAELSFGFGNPSVSGVDVISLSTGDMADSYFSIAGGYKTDINDKISLAVIFDQPFGADATYSQGLYAGTEATLDSNAVTLLASYDVSDRFVVFGGGVAQSITGVAAVPLAGGYTVDVSSDTGFGFVAGAAFQIPKIALRVALTYRSEITTAHDTLEFGLLNTVTDITTPQSINLEFQTGINPTTLIFGSVRWVEWSKFEIDPPTYPSPDPLVDYEFDRIAYNLGVGKKLSDSLSAAVTLGYEATLGGSSSVLAPTDGYFSIGAGLTYSTGNMEITAGAKYLWIGDTNDPTVGTFEGNSALGFGLKIGFSI